MTIPSLQYNYAKQYIKTLVMSQNVTRTDNNFYDNVENATGVKRRDADNMVYSLYVHKLARVEMAVINGNLECLTVRLDTTEDELRLYVNQLGGEVAELKCTNGHDRKG